MKLGDAVTFFAGVGTVIGLHRNGKMLLVKTDTRDKPFFVKANNAKLATA